MNRWLQWLFKRRANNAQAHAGVSDPALIARIQAFRQQNAQQAVLDQYNDIYLFHLQSPRAWARYGLWSAALVLVVFIGWAAWFNLDEVTSAQGKVITSSREQVVQSMEAGVVTDILVKEGQVVESGQPLLRIDDVKIGANMKETKARTQGGDRLTSLYSFDLSNNNKILDLNFGDSLKINVGSTLSMGDFSVSGLGPYNFSMSGLNPTTVSFNDLQQSLRFQSTNSINGPLLIKYTGTELQDTQGRPIPSYTWMIGSDLPNQDYDNYQILNANRLTQAEQKAGVMILGGGGEDELTGGLGADTLVGGLDSDTLTGGLGSDTFVFAKDSGDIAGVTGDVIKDFNFGKTGGTNADTISLYQLFDSTVVSQLGKGASNDASTLSAYLKLEWTKLDSNLQMVCSVDKDGRSNFSKLFTMTDLIGSVGSGTYQANQADMSLLNGTESTNALLQKMLEEGRLVVQ